MLYWYEMCSTQESLDLLQRIKFMFYILHGILNKNARLWLNFDHHLFAMQIICEMIPYPIQPICKNPKMALLDWLIESGHK